MNEAKCCRQNELSVRSSLEGYIAGVLSTFPPWDKRHPIECSPMAKAVLDAVLSHLFVPSPCPTCGGAAWILDTRVNGWWEEFPTPRMACSDCTDGMRPSLAVWRDDLEQVGVVATEPMMSGEGKRFTAHVRAPLTDHEYRAFRLREGTNR